MTELAFTKTTGQSRAERPADAVHRASRARRRHSLLPREHGAYGQVTLPLLTAILTSRFTPPSAWLTVGAIAAFLAHEPLLVLLGRRGARARRDAGWGAAGWLAACCFLLVSSYGVAAVQLPAPAQPALLMIAVLIGAVLALVALDQERSAAGEALVALALPSFAVPIAVAGAVPLERALAIWFIWALVFVSGTLVVRAIIVHQRQPLGAARRLTGPALALVAILVAWAMDWLTRSEALAGVVPVALAGALAGHPPHPRRLRRVGWSLLVATAITAGILIS